jgi:lipopolysaccharide export system protein LptA
VSRGGLLIAIGISLILVSLVLLLSSGGGRGRPAQSHDAAREIPDIAGPVLPRDMRDSPGFAATEDARILLKDRNDPARIAWDIEYESLDPSASGGRASMTAPRAWYYLNDRDAVFVRSDTADFLMPDVTSEPESGRFSGNVELVMVRRNADGTLPTVGEAAGGVTVKTPWLDFDSGAGELSTTAQVDIESEVVSARCEGLRAVLNEVDQRLEFLEVPGSLVALIQPPPAGDGSAEPDDEPSSPATAEGQSPSRPAAPIAEPPVEQFYAATFAGEVRVSQPKRRVSADRALAWVRLVDNRFDGALAGGGVRPRPVQPMEAALLSLVVAAAESQPEGIDPDELSLGETVTFSCSGPSTVRPVNDRPAALGSGESLALRLECDAEGRVRFEDDALAAVGDAATIEYAFATKLLTLTGPASAPAAASVAETGRLIAERVTLGLATGVGQAVGPGRLDAAEAGRSVAWGDQADVVFRVRNGWMTGSLEQAIASGRVELRDGETLITAEDLNARFAEGAGSSPIERAVLIGGVRAVTAQGELTARRVDVRFDVADGESRARSAVATGEVAARQEDRRLTAGQVEADLATDETGEIRVVSARARDGVRFERDDGSFGAGDFIEVEAESERVIVEGSPGTVGSGGAVVLSERIALDGASDTIQTPGPGRLSVESESGGGVRVAAAWTGSMRYSDSTGELETIGGVEIVSTPDGLSRDTIRAERVTAIVEPADDDEAQEDGGLGRRLISAVAEGAPASAELLRFAEPGAADPSRVSALLGSRIEMDNAAGVLHVPGAGRLLVSDTQLDPEQTDPSSLRGSALFDWDGSLHLDRPAGRAVMRDRVRMVHRPADETLGVIELESERLVGRFEPGSALTDSVTGDLTGAEALGAVWARSGTMQLLADRLDYDPATGAADARASDGGWVTMFDPSRSTPITAAELLWTIGSGRVEVRRPGPASIPR